MKRFYITLSLVGLFAVSFFVANIVFATPPQYFQSTQIIGTGLETPTGFDFAPDSRIFILE